jgi:hypothetical protein
MAYVTTNPPRKVSSGIGNGPNVWHYSSADAKATVVAAAYISNAKQLGMKVGDVVHVFDTATPGFAIMGVLTFTVNTANLGYVANS